MAQVIQVGQGNGLTAISDANRRRIYEMPCGPTARPNTYYSLLEAFCINFAVPNLLGQINSMCMVLVAAGRQAGTVVTMDSNFKMDKNRPTSGYRIDLQHYNSQDPDARIRGCANFQIQTNTANSVSVGEVHIKPGNQFTPADVISAFNDSMVNRRAYLVID